MSEHNLERVIDAQGNNFTCLRGEIKAGKKRSHWMWSVFHQMKGLGRRMTANYYGIENL